MSHALVALYAGDSPGTARIVGATCDPETLRIVAERLLNERENQPRQKNPIVSAMEDGRQRALRLVADGEWMETANEADVPLHP